LSGTPGDFSETQELRRLPDEVERQALLARFFGAHRDRLRRMVEVRLDPRLKPRVDPSDILQEVFLEAAKRLREYLRDAPAPLFLWLRRLAAQKLRDAHRRHLATKARDARREVSIDRQAPAAVSSVILAEQLAAKGASPDEEAILAEIRRRLQAAIESMDPGHREILVLRHVEHLTNRGRRGARGPRAHGEQAVLPRHREAEGGLR
jgi:RNA polymerase sigma-70 factor (ECF subfamily)